MSVRHREDEAAARLAEPAFLRRVRAALGVAAPAAPSRARATSAGTRRTKAVDPSECHDGVCQASDLWMQPVWSNILSGLWQHKKSTEP